MRQAVIWGSLGLMLGCSTSTYAEPATCSSERTKIVGGSNARLRDWPGQAVIRLHAEGAQRSFYFCGGTAITDRWIITAAHCMPDYTDKLTGVLNDEAGKPVPAKLQVVLGTSDLTTTRPENVFNVEKVVVHESYLAAIVAARSAGTEPLVETAIGRIAPEIGEDVALLRLDRPWTGPKSRLALSGSADPLPHSQVRVAGFGLTKDGGGLNRYTRAGTNEVLFAGAQSLLEAAVETTEPTVCSTRYKQSKVGEGQICAGLDQGGRDSCQGDSGGPLITRDKNDCPYQVGLVSWGVGCGDAGAYGVYTRISHYADWIQRQVGPLSGADSGAGDVAAAHVPPALLSEGLQQIHDLLGQAGGVVKLGIRGGNRVTLGKDVVFETTSTIPGRLLVVDVNANGEFTLIFPNKFVESTGVGQVDANRQIVIPGPGYGFTAFKAIEPVGRSKLIALVVPQDFDIERIAAPAGTRTKGFAPVQEPTSYFMRLIQQIEAAVGTARSANNVEALKRWGYSVIDYEIVD